MEVREVEAEVRLAEAEAGLDAVLPVVVRLDVGGPEERGGALEGRVGLAGEEPLGAGASAVATVTFAAPLAGTPYSLRVIYRGLPEALLLGPANSRAAGKTTLGLGESPT